MYNIHYDFVYLQYTIYTMIFGRLQRYFICVQIECYNTLYGDCNEFVTQNWSKCSCEGAVNLWLCGVMWPICDVMYDVMRDVTFHHVICDLWCDVQREVMSHVICDVMFDVTCDAIRDEMCDFICDVISVTMWWRDVICDVWCDFAMTDVW